MDQALIAHLLNCYPPPPLLTAKEVAYVLNLQIDTVRIYRIRHPDLLPFEKIGSRFFYKTEDVVAFVRHLSPRKRATLKELHHAHTAN